MHNLISTLSYLDEDDGQGGFNVVVTDTAIVDCEFPAIVGIDIIEVLTHEATVRVMTNEESSVTIMYGTDCDSLDEATISGTLADVHEVRLSGLSDNTTYRFEVHAMDAANNTVVDDNDGSCYFFTTEDVPDFFTEQDSGFDMDGMSVTFTPYTNVDEYRACAETITALPTNPNQGAVVNLSDDDYEIQSTLQPVHLYGESYTRWWD